MTSATSIEGIQSSNPYARSGHGGLNPRYASCVLWRATAFYILSTACSPPLSSVRACFYACSRARPPATHARAPLGVSASSETSLCCAVHGASLLVQLSLVHAVEVLSLGWFHGLNVPKGIQEVMPLVVGRGSRPRPPTLRRAAHRLTDVHILRGLRYVDGACSSGISSTRCYRCLSPSLC